MAATSLDTKPPSHPGRDPVPARGAVGKSSMQRRTWAAFDVGSAGQRSSQPTVPIFGGPGPIPSQGSRVRTTGSLTTASEPDQTQKGVQLRALIAHTLPMFRQIHLRAGHGRPARRLDYAGAKLSMTRLASSKRPVFP